MTGSLHTGFFCRARIRIQRETGADMVMTADEFCHIQIQRFSPPHRQIFLRLRDGLFSLAQISFDFLIRRQRTSGRSLYFA